MKQTIPVPAAIAELDHQDSFAGKRSEFRLPADTIYLNGNSLGPLTFAAQERLVEACKQEWRQDLIGGWNKHGWLDLPIQVGEKIARLIGAKTGQTVACDSTSLNLFKVLSAALSLQSGRTTVLTQEENFPTDLYIAQGMRDLLGEHHCKLKNVQAQELSDSIDESIAVLMLTQVDFRSGYKHDIEILTKKAHEVGALVVWDLAHSAGAFPLDLDKWQVDFAVGCGYKYLNGGPGAPAFLYAAERHHKLLRQPLYGWMGHAQPFLFERNYVAASGVQKFSVGTPNVLSLAALQGALSVFDNVDLHALREKSNRLAATFMRLMSDVESLQCMNLISPIDAAQRGSQLSYTHPYAYAVTRVLIEQGVVVDYRAPDCIRFGLTPLYTRYMDIWRAVEALKEVIESRRFERAQYQADYQNAGSKLRITVT